MKIKAKLRRIGNSVGVLLPREVITGTKLGEEIEIDVITDYVQVPIVGTLDSKTEQISFRKAFNTEMCTKHEGSMKGTCGCN